MLSDALRQTRMEIAGIAGLEGLQHALMVFEAEAGSMELIIHYLTKQPHVPIAILDMTTGAADGDRTSEEVSYAV